MSAIESTRETSSETVLEITNLSVDYGSHRVLDDVQLSVQRGELIALLGPSGSGKTTVIRAIGGFLTPSSGEIRLGNRDLVPVPVHKRNIGIVFQSYALFPHMTVLENIAYPMKIRKLGRQAIAQRCSELIDLVQLGDHRDKRIGKLSGGQQQRVALARALAMDPELLLLDEPLSNLDANLRREVGEEIRRLQLTTGTTTIMVTHDRQEAFGMADRIAVLRDGRIEQLDTPDSIYRRPSSPFMASFVGDANLLQGVTGASSGDSTEVVTAAGTIHVGGRLSPGQNVTVLIRPEDITIRSMSGPRLNGFEAIIAESYYYGSSEVTRATAGGVSLQIQSSGAAAIRPVPGDTVRLAIRSQDCTIVPDVRPAE